MNGSEILEYYRSGLSKALRELSDDVPEIGPLNIFPWLAMSLLQKEILRGRFGFRHDILPKLKFWLRYFTAIWSITPVT